MHGRAGAGSGPGNVGGLMDIQNKLAPRRGKAKQVASDMSDAVSYLIGVARSAGLEHVARKLNDVNAELRELKFMQLELGLDTEKARQPEHRPTIKH